MTGSDERTPRTVTGRSSAPAAARVGHRTSVDRSEADRVDTEAYAAFCDEDGCPWLGPWRHVGDVESPTAEDAEREAREDGAEHERETRPN